MTDTFAELEVSNDLLTWAETALRLHEVAESLCRSSFVPESFKKKSKDEWRAKEDVISDVVAAILAGDEVGLRPLAALRSIQRISGTPAMTALAMRGLVQANGHEVWVEGEPTETKAIVCGRRRGSDKVHRSAWTIDRARKMHLTGKPQWIAQPLAMLVARATSECCRLTASDVLLGMPYSIEELQDQDEETADTPPRKRTARRQPIPAPPSLDDQQEPAPPEEPESPEEIAAEAATDQGDDICPGCGGEMHPPTECSGVPGE